MSPSRPDNFPTVTLPSRRLRLGFLSLTDAAPLIVAQELGFFARHDLRVELHREIGWATIREKIIYGELDAAQAPAPMLWSAQLGLGCPSCEVLTALVLNRNGNAITLSRALWAAGVRDAITLRDHIRTRPDRPPMTFGVVFPFSSHHLLLREWLQSAGLEPDRDVRIVVVPPAQMFRNLNAETIDGFCAGEPWNTLAVHEGVGWCPAWSAALHRRHIEKVLMVTRRFADDRPADHARMLRALAEAGAWCDEAENREPLSELLSRPAYLNLAPQIIASTLLGRLDCANGRIETVPDFHVFSRDNAGLPSVSEAEAQQRALSSAELIPALAASDPELPRRLFREDLHREILNPHPPLHELIHTSDPRGVAEPTR